MASMAWSRSAEDHFARPAAPRASFLPVRKAMSGIFRADKTSQAPSQSRRPNTADSDRGSSMPTSPPKRRKRLSLRRSLASPLLSQASLSTYNTDSSPGSTSSNSNSSMSSSIGSSSSTKSVSFRAAQVNSRCLFPDPILTSRLEEEDESFVPPKRPACPAPLLDLSVEECEMVDYDDGFASYISRHNSHFLQRRTLQCASEESFQCRGLGHQPVSQYATEEISPPQRKSRPSFLSLVAPSALKVRPRKSVLSMDSVPSSPSGCSESSSINVPSDFVDCKSQAGADSGFDTSPWMTQSDADMAMFCPSSPKPRVRLQLTLPPSFQSARHLSLQIESNSSTLELKESLCSTLLRFFHYNISPSSIALFVILNDCEDPKQLENDRPLYQEGIQDDDEILVRF